MILCIAAIGSVLAIAVFGAEDVQGTIKTDAYLFLEMNSDITTSLELVKGTPIVKAVNLKLRASDETKGYFKVIALDKEDKTLSKVKFSLYSSEDCTTLLKDVNGNDCTMTGSGTLVYLIPETKETVVTVYLSILLDDDITENEFNNAGGKLTLRFTDVA